jgi:hypothetical protein
MKHKRNKKSKAAPKKPRTISQRTLWRSKRKAQALCRELVASGKLAPEDVFFIRPDQIKGAKVDWSAEPLIDDPEPTSRHTSKKSKRSSSPQKSLAELRAHCDQRLAALKGKGRCRAIAGGDQGSS